MTPLAKKRLAAFQRWLSLSSSPLPSGFEKPIGRGAFASIVSQRLDQPLAGAFEPDALPIGVSADLADGVHLPPVALAGPVNQPRMADRLEHLLLKWGDGVELPPVIAIGLQDAAETLAEAQDAAGIGVGIPDLPRVFLPLYRLPPKDHRRLAPRLPLICTKGDPAPCEIAEAHRIPAERTPLRLFWR